MSVNNFQLASMLIFVAISHVVMSQEVAFGLKGGLNLGTLDLSNPESSYDSKMGYHGGLFLRGKFNKIAVQPEVLIYTQEGEIFNSVAGSAKESFTYLAVPLMFKFYPSNHLGLNIQAGPHFAFLLDGERTTELRLLTVKEDIKDYYESSDIAISTGAGYDFGFGLNIDVRYNIGVKDINNETDGEEVKSRVFMVSLGWNFGR